MTGPAIFAPPTQGNALTDLASVGGGLASGFLAEKERQRKAALEDAMRKLNENRFNLELEALRTVTQPKAAAEIGHLNAETNVGIPAEAAAHTAAAGQATAETGLINQRNTALTHTNELSGPEQQAELHRLAPNYIYDPNMTRGEADERIKELMTAQMMMNRLGMTEGRFNQTKVLDELNRFNSDPEVRNLKGSIFTYKNSKLLTERGAPITQPSLLLDLGQMLGMPGQPNARAIGVELSNLLNGAGLAYSQRVGGFINKVFNEGDKFTLDNMSMQAIPELMRDIMRAKKTRYDQLRSDTRARIKGVLGIDVPEQVVGGDPFSDIRGELEAPNTSTPTTAPGLNYLPKKGG